MQATPEQVFLAIAAVGPLLCYRFDTADPPKCILLQQISHGKMQRTVAYRLI